MTPVGVLYPPLLVFAFRFLPPASHLVSPPLHRHLAMAASDWITMPQHGTIPPYSVFSKPIEKSLSDQRHYRMIRLENGLTAMVVHDPKTENAAASIDVAVGHLSDPVSEFLSPIILSYS